MATPAVVVRCLERALGASTSPIVVGVLQQAGELRTTPLAARWLPFTAEERVRPRELVFAWEARVRLLPGVHLRIADGYGGGEGRGTIRLGPLTLSHAAGGAALGQGALLRLLAEAPWYPTLLQPSDALTWRDGDAQRATATLRDGDVTVELEFRFDAEADIASIYSAGRPCRVRGGYELRAWEGRFGDYASVGGVRIPRAGEVGWYVDERWQCVWRGRIIAARYERESPRA